ncbi:copper chaperone PCu(A)C [Mycolicibacterium monacense]|uniref:Copper chaperone PCu(A)C n=4 Tax=Mycobacteriaceae TaxID=1762 RepID=A0AAD1IU86_MYCMB|nr:hypothetical protein [Mycolicibacterium monacense]MDA4101000.1 hypothetical protein [Mycolicibacterium monacense DSM 44395]ORB19762.1 hypothetical protein BST34_14195 [Mycolicibacterium monacense DSM 44395]QHP86388.1 hypothetical protein EWR22_14075 [Mycolicibacterium monacense DSM 44395]BBZ60588.1 hypothetical protein MMON_18890 [Mycolicibacterium monacense]
MGLTPTHHFNTSLVIITAVALATSGCGEDPPLGSSNRGSGSETERTSVENAFIVPTFLPGRCAIQLDAGAEMRFTVANGDPTESERLLSVSTSASSDGDIASGVEIPAESTVSFGQPTTAAVDGGGTVSAVQLGRLAPNLTPGMSASVTFHFDRAGDIEMPVPVEACPTQQK